MFVNQIPRMTNELGFKFFNALPQPIDSNAIISPWSLLNTLGVLLLGSTYQSGSQNELLSIIGYPRENNLTLFHENVLNTRWRIGLSLFQRHDLDKTFKLGQENFLFYNAEKVQVYRLFRYGLNVYYESYIDDFSPTDTERGPLHVRINRWLGYASDQAYKNFEEPKFSNNTGLLSVFLGYFYVKGHWLHPLEVELRGEFYNGGRLSSPVMTNFTKFLHPKTIPFGLFSKYIYPNRYKQMKKMSKALRQLECRVFELSFKYNEGRNYSMVFLVPNKATQIEALQRKLNNSVLLEIYSHLVPTRSYVTLPKFDIELEFEGEEPLRRLGFKNIFLALRDFDLMFEKTPLFGYTKIKQKTRLAMDGSGADVMSGSRSADLGEEAPLPNPLHLVLPNLVLNRPFLYILRHIPTNVSLLMGRMSTIYPS